MAHTKRTQSGDRVPGPRKNNSGLGLVLDDYLQAIADMRRTFKLAKPGFDLSDVESQAAASAAINAIVKETFERHSPEIYSKQHALLSPVGKQIYGDWTQTQAYSGHRIRQDWIEPVLRRIIEVGLQTVVQLPERDRKPASMPRLKTLAAALDGLAEKLDTALRNDEFLARTEILFEEGNPNRERVQKIRDELRWGADAVKAMAKLRLKRIKSDSPNPQIRLAMYFVQWITSCTGGQRYRDLATLFHAGFSVAGGRMPSWIDRLGVEMNLKRKRRKRSVGTITS
jgi:hypothetical protein